MASDDRAKTDEIMAALAAQHWASDVLMAALINHTANSEQVFMPSKSIVWPQFTAAKEVLDKLKFEHPDITALGFCEYRVEVVNGHVPCGKVAGHLMRCEQHSHDFFMCCDHAAIGQRQGLKEMKKVNGH